jgi:hypothetical protein
MATTKEIVAVWGMIHANYTYYARQLGESYGDERARDMLDQLLSGVWLPILADVPGEVLKAAALQYIARGNVYFPQVGELREIAFDLTDTAGGRTQTPYTGWQEVMALMRSHSAYDLRPLAWTDEVARQALEAIGGMRAVRFCAETSLTVLMTQFVKAYRTIQGRVQDGQRMLPQVKALIGRMAMENRLAAGAERPALAAGEEELWNG